MDDLDDLPDLVAIIDEIAVAVGGVAGVVEDRGCGRCLGFRLDAGIRVRLASLREVLMARAWIEDLWLTDATVTMPDGSVVKMPPSAAVKRSLAAHPDDPLKARVPREYRTARYGKGKRWRVNWRVARPDGVVRKTTKAFADYKDAEAFVAAMEDDIRAGRYIDPRDGERRFGDVAQLWLAAQGNVKGATYNRYTRELKYYIYPRWQHVAIASITQDDVIAWVHALQQATAPVNFNTARRPHPLGPSSIRNIVKVIFGGILKFAADPHRRWILFNPVDGIKLPKAASNQARVYLTMNEIMAIADAAATVTSSKHTSNSEDSRIAS